MKKYYALTFIIIVILAAAGLFWWNKESDSCNNEACLRIRQTFSSFVDTTSVESDEWKSYKSKENAFAILYPPNWDIREINGALLINSPENLRFYTDSIPGVTERPLDLLLTVSSDLDIPAKRKEINAEDKYPIFSKDTIFGKNEANISNSQGLGFGDISVYIIHNTKLFEFSFNANIREEKLKIIKTIISSLEFI